MAYLARQKMKITLGLCTKNSEKTIRECMERILNQSYPKELVEIIIVDGGSKDETIEIAKNMMLKSHLNSRFFNDDGEGLGKARQIVLNNSNTKYIVWIDSDVLIERDFTENQIEFMECNPLVGIATGKFLFKKDVHASLSATLENLAKYTDSVEYTRTRRQSGLPPNDASIYSVEASRQAGGYDANITGAGEDVDIVRRMRLKGWLTAVNEKARYCTVTRETWQDFWKERMWFGYGNHMLYHKYKDSQLWLWVNAFLSVYVGFKQSLKAYRLTSERKSIMLPLSYVFSAIALLYGFNKAHYDAYGHQKQS
jgi:glycosyltransferase involved in cell wall biosynthesis